MPLRARRTERVDREVAEQPDVSVGARDDLVVDHEPPADAGADREHRELAHLPTLAEPALGLHQRVEVVGDGDVAVGGRGQRSAEIDLAPAEERRPRHPAIIPDPSAEPDTHGREAGDAGPEARDENGQLADHGVRLVGPQIDHLAGEDVGVQIGEHPGSRLAGELDADEVLATGVDIERLRRAATRADRHVVALVQHSMLDQRLGQPRQTGGRQAEPTSQLRARQRAVPQDVEGDATLRVGERAPRRARRGIEIERRRHSVNSNAVEITASASPRNSPP